MEKTKIWLKKIFSTERSFQISALKELRKMSYEKKNLKFRKSKESLTRRFYQVSNQAEKLRENRKRFYVRQSKVYSASFKQYSRRIEERLFKKNSTKNQYWLKNMHLSKSEKVDFALKLHRNIDKAQKGFK